MSGKKTKVCSRCKDRKSLNQFFRFKNRKGYKQCIDCIYYMREWKRKSKNREKNKMNLH